MQVTLFVLCDHVDPYAVAHICKTITIVIVLRQVYYALYVLCHFVSDLQMLILFLIWCIIEFL